MSVLEDLIKKYCPDGVEYKTLSELGEFSNIGVDKKKVDGEKEIVLLNFMDIMKNMYIDKSIPKMIVTASDYKIEKCTIEKGDIFITPSSETIDEIGFASVITETIPNACYSYHIMRFRLFEYNMITSIFIRHCFNSYFLRKQIRKFAQGITRFGLTLDKWKSLKIPLPPIEVQKEIVRILDTFTEYQDCLNEELTLRKKQYEYYRDKILTFGDDVEWKNLSEIAEIGTGSSNTNEEIENGKYPFFVRSQEVRSKNEYEYDETAIITSGDGVGVGKIFHYVEGKYALHQRAYRIHIIDKNVIPKYYFYYMKTTFLSYIEKTSFHSSVTSIRRPMLNNFPVPVPPFEEQERIVKILDSFDALCNDISSGLPAEIEMRKKQYEYYRDKLLTFKEKKV
ncbi:restriction endonuclease subunit S [uncultured Brachyspira sp.]|uniref:restriction endonuclease subunit S n=1 Tax=uncultured Brachyspira sp. TaxID=221953 RepID=UPI00262FDBE6|nr:restriction endonuclease subunit S [uncultured Brachyspira sp.]